MLRLARPALGLCRAAPLRRTFAAESDDPRFFLLQFSSSLAEGEPYQAYLQHLAQAQARKEALLSGKLRGSDEMFVLFQCENECVPYDFLKRVTCE